MTFSGCGERDGEGARGTRVVSPGPHSNVGSRLEPEGASVSGAGRPRVYRTGLDRAGEGWSEERDGTRGRCGRRKNTEVRRSVSGGPRDTRTRRRGVYGATEGGEDGRIQFCRGGKGVRDVLGVGSRPTRVTKSDRPRTC